MASPDVALKPTTEYSATSNEPNSSVTNADEIAKIAKMQFEAGVKFKQPRMDDIQKNEELYLNKQKRALKHRYNVPLPIMAGFVDTLLSKIDDPPRVIRKATSEEDVKKALKMNAQFEFDSSSTQGKWAMKDRWAKKMAILSGRGILKYYASSDPEYKSCLEVVDYKDFVAEPLGGADLEKHLFCGQQNIFITKTALENGKQYDKAQVTKLIATVNTDEFKKNYDTYKNKMQRFSALGLDINTNNYVGENLFNFVEWYMEYKGTRYYLLFEPSSGIWVRCEVLKEVFESNLYPYESWATHDDPFNFWSKSMADDIRPVAEAMVILFNQELDNRSKQNWHQRAYDPDMFTDPSLLEWRPDGLVPATTNNGIKSIANGIYEFQVGELGGTINFIQWLQSYLGQQTGITAEAQGVAKTDAKVGVFFGQVQQTADRLGLINKSYAESWTGLALRYDWGLWEHMGEKMMVKTIGIQGIEWDLLTKEDAEPDFDIMISGGNAEAQIDEVKKKTRSAAIQQIIANPLLAPKLSPTWTVENILRNGGFEDEDIRMALDVENEGNQELMGEAAKAIRLIVEEGKTPKPNRGANTAFIQKIMDFAVDTELPLEKYKALMDYADQHIQIAADNMARKASLMQSIAVATNKNAPPPADNAVASGMTPAPEGGAVPPSAAGVATGISALNNPTP